MKPFRRLPKGELAAHGMAEWFSDLTPAEQHDLADGYERLYEGDIELVDSRDTQQRFLLELGNCAQRVNVALAERIWLMALGADGDEPITRHFVYHNLIELYYKQRETRTDALGSCVRYCIEDIARTGQFIAAWKKDSKRIYSSVGREIPEDELKIIPRILSFERLIIIFEKQGRITEAIEICQQAIYLGLHDKTKGGFEARLARLQKKR